MCEPTTLLIAAAAVTATGQIQSGIAAKKMGNYEYEIAQKNAAMDRNAAQDAIQRGRIEEQRQYRRMAQLQGAQRAAMAANGIDTEFGSALDIQVDTKKIGWEDAATIRENAIREAKGFEINAWNQEASGRAAKAKGQNAFVGSLFDAGGTILSTASKVAKK